MKVVEVVTCWTCGGSGEDCGDCFRGVVPKLWDVIELTKESKAIFGDGHGDRYRTRLVSEWEAADG